MGALDASVKSHLDWLLKNVEEAKNANVVAVVSPILPGLDRRLRDAIETLEDRKDSIAVILDTPGGIVEVVERMVATLRSHYEDMTVIVPDRAMSAGTIFALSADRIMVDYFSCLGPIDPQIEKGIRLPGDFSTNTGRNGLGTLEAPNGNGAVNCIDTIGASTLRVTIPAWVGRKLKRPSRGCRS